MLKSVLSIIAVMLLLGSAASAQVTSSSISGFVKSASGEALIGATIVATHVPTGSVYKTQSGKSGTYNIDNMTPGGPYTVEVSYVGLGTEKKTNIFLNLGETYKNDVSVTEKASELAEVVVTGTAKTDIGKGGTSTTLSRDKLESMPTVGRNLSDYLRATPQIKLASSSNASSENAMSIAGQNLRFNSFYVDGAVNNDVYGLAYSGTNGGQSSISPLSIDAIDQIQVMISPYDASIGNFTGGAINAITKSGTNDIHGSAYILYRNQDLAGKTPTGPKDNAIKYSDFTNKTYGLTIGGPIIKNKLFYFLSGEIQRDETPNPFDLKTYNGDVKSKTDLDNLRASIMSRSNGYDPGIYDNSLGELKSDKITAKVDWNINDKQKLTASYRYTGGDRLIVFSSTPTQLNFSNYGYRFPTKTHSGSLELKSKIGKNASNRLLFTLTDVEDNRGALSGQQAPSVTITNGTNVTIRFGTEANSTFNYLKQTTLNLSDQYRYTYGKNTFSAGFEAEHYSVTNAFISNNTGTYQYNSVADFLNDARPRSYQYNFPLVGSGDEKTSDAAAKFKVFRGALFINDEIKVNSNLSITAGVRADYYNFITNPIVDKFAVDSAMPKFQQYYDLEGARPGQMANVPVSISPRLGFTYKVNKLGIVVRGGAGLYSGRIPLVWPGGVYNQTGRSSAGYTVSSSSNTPVYNQDLINYRVTPYTTSELGINLDNAKGELDLLTKKFKTPKVLRTSLAIDKNLGSGWTVTLEGMYTKNINDVATYNVNIIPPQSRSVGPDNRKVYGTATSTAINIPIRSSGANPYTAAYLIGNQKGQKGYSYNFTFLVNKSTRTGFNLSASYNYGQSYVVNDNQSSTNSSQWQSNESINGRNELTRSISDNSAGHRIFAFASKKFTYAKGHLATTLGFTYNGQSGLPYSFVYNGQAVRDGLSNPYDLVYIPTATDITNQTFQALTVGTVTYNIADQKAALETYIQKDKYLSSHRGQYAERNASRTQFTNVVDMRLAQDFSVKAGKNKYSFQIIYSMFNFTNFLNRDWGHQYQTSFDQFQLMGVSYVPNTLTPRYTFNPTTVTPGTVTTTVNPTYSSRWTSQIELRFRF